MWRKSQEMNWDDNCRIEFTAFNCRIEFLTFFEKGKSQFRIEFREIIELNLLKCFDTYFVCSNVVFFVELWSKKYISIQYWNRKYTRDTNNETQTSKKKIYDNNEILGIEWKIYKFNKFEKNKIQVWKNKIQVLN